MDRRVPADAGVVDEHRVALGDRHTTQLEFLGGETERQVSHRGLGPQCLLDDVLPADLAARQLLAQPGMPSQGAGIAFPAAGPVS
ncbi:hypothetical protein [Streptomyces sp. NPDC091040]|uniref:hypothetical protein n=1 Tax=Streptomyces sp. NPDC091040 TaxID=3365972 RepID=UPI003814FBAE